MERLRKAVRLTLGTLLRTGSVLALSVTYGDTSPKGRGLGKKMNLAWTAKGSHFGELASRSDD